jgi:hypothetical protein
MKYEGINKYCIIYASKDRFEGMQKMYGKLCCGYKT